MGKKGKKEVARERGRIGRKEVLDTRQTYWKRRNGNKGS